MSSAVDYIDNNYLHDWHDVGPCISHEVKSGYYMYLARVTYGIFYIVLLPVGKSIYCLGYTNNVDHTGAYDIQWKGLWRLRTDYVR